MDFNLGNSIAYLNNEMTSVKLYVEAGLNALSSNLEMMYGVSGEIKNIVFEVKALKNVNYMGMSPCILSKAIHGKNNGVPFLLLFKQSFVRELLNIVTGGDSSELTFDDFDLGTSAEIIGQVYNSFGSSVSLQIGKPVAAFNSESLVLNNYGDLIQALKIGSDDQILNISFTFGFEGYQTNDVVIIANVDYIKLLEASLHPAPTPTPAPSQHKSDSKPVLKTETPIPANINTINENYISKELDETNKMFQQSYTQNNMQLLMNIPLEMSVQIGSTTKLIKEICEFSNGTVIELGKPFNEAIDIFANDKMIAHGEIVVIDDNFGVRFTEILDIKKIIAAIAGDD